MKTLNMKLAILLEYQNIKSFLQKVTLQNGLERLLWLKKLQIPSCEHIILMILKEKKFLEPSMKKNC